MELLLTALAIALFIVLAFIDLRLATLALLIWLILSMLLNRGKVYAGRRALIRTNRAVYVAFTASRDFKKSFMSLSRGMRILGGDVEPSRLVEFAVNVSRKSSRMKGRHRLRGAMMVVDYKLPRGRYFKVHWPATIRRSAASGEFPAISRDSLRERVYAGRGKVSLVIVLDSSASMMYSIRGILTALEAVKREARRYRDRVALVVSKGFGAVIAQYPTTNFNLVLSKISKIGLDDFTPLAAGLFMGYNLALRERSRGYEPILVVISDGNANVPLEKQLLAPRRPLTLDPAYHSVMEVAHLISKSRIETILVNTKHREVMADAYDGYVSGTQLMIQVARMVKGEYVGIIS